MQWTKSVALAVALFASIACKQERNGTPAPAASPSGGVPLASAEARPVTDFEGEIVVVATGKFAGSGGAPLNLTLLAKDGKLRIDLPDSITFDRGFGKAHLLALPADKKLYAILDTKKQVVLLELDKLAEQAKAFTARDRHLPGASPTPGSPAQLTKTDKVDTVAA